MRVIFLMREKTLNGTVAHLPGVRASVNSAALEIGVKAEAILAGHHDTGAAQIDVDQDAPGKYGDIDAMVWLVDKAAMSIEHRHRHNFSHKMIEGLHILGRAAGLY